MLLAKYDHAQETESVGGDSLYGRKNKDFGEAIGEAISRDPSGGLSEAGKIGGFKVVQAGQHQLVYGSDVDGICYAVVTGRDYPSRVAISGLGEMYNSFASEFGSDARTALEGTLTKKAKKQLKAFCKKYDSPAVDKTQQLLGSVEAVKGQMQQNIGSMLKNQEDAGTLKGKTEELNEQAGMFQTKSKAVKVRMKWKNYKTTAMLVGVVLLVLALILVPIILKFT